MVYYPPINNKLGPTNMAAMGSKTIGSSIQSSFEVSGLEVFPQTLIQLRYCFGREIPTK